MEPILAQARWAVSHNTGHPRRVIAPVAFHESDELAAEIIENLQSALQGYTELQAQLRK